jgi:adenylate kinase
LEDNEIYDLFESLLKKVILHQPTDPLQFMINKLKEEVKVKVILMGPPGMGRGQHAQKLADHFGVPCINAGKLISQYVSDLGAEEMDTSGGLVSDEHANQAVVSAVEALGDEGWILDGFPRTRAQALALQNAKIIPDKVLLLNAPTKMVEEALEKKIGEGSDRVHRRAQQFLRHLLHTVEVYAPMVQQLDIDALNPSQIAAELIKMVPLRPASNAPLRPVRVCCLGPLGSGRTTLAKNLATHYGAVTWTRLLSFAQ